MFVVGIIIVAVTILIGIWILKQKNGERFTKKEVVKLFLFGLLAYVITMGIGLLISDPRELWKTANPYLSGFLTALITAAILEEGGKFIAFRLAMHKDREVLTWSDAVIAAMTVSLGFIVIEDIQYAFFGNANLLRALIPGHFLFQFAMGYYYAKARVTEKKKYHVLSFVVPVILHTAFDLFLLMLRDLMTNPDGTLSSAAEVMEKNGNMVVILLGLSIAVLAVALVALIAVLRRLRRWKIRNERTEPLQKTA